MSNASHTEKAIQLTAKFLDARDTLKRLNSPEDYKRKIGEYRHYIEAGMDNWKMDSLHATMELLRMTKDSPFTMLGLMAALVEMDDAP